MELNFADQRLVRCLIGLADEKSRPVGQQARGHLPRDELNAGGLALDTLSKHYDDQVKMFVAMKTKPVLFTMDQLKGNIEDNYTPQDHADQR